MILKGKTKIALIDSDSLCYFSSKETIEESKKHLDLYLKNILKAVKTKRFILFISEGKYFRHDLYPKYKQNRPTTQLLFVKELKEYLKEKYKAYSFEGVEADDLICYYSARMSNSIICSIDKDLLKQIPGNHFNYYHGTFDYHKTSEEEALYFLWGQVLMGDVVDNIPGIPGIGPKKVEKILGKVGTFTNEEMQLRVFKAYLDYYKNNNLALDRMTLNFKLIYLLKTEEDFKMYLKTLPQIDRIMSLQTL